MIAISGIETDNNKWAKKKISVGTEIMWNTTIKLFFQDPVFLVKGAGPHNKNVLTCKKEKFAFADYDISLIMKILLLFLFVCFFISFIIIIIINYFGQTMISLYILGKTRAKPLSSNFL